MNLPLLKKVLTDLDEFISNAQLKSLALEILELIPMDGIEGFGLDPEEIMEVVLRAAVGTTSVNGVTTKTSDTPNRKTVMDWLHTLETPAMLDAVNDILALVAMTILDRHGREPSVSTSWTIRSMATRRMKTNSDGCKPVTERRSAIGIVQRSSLLKESR